MGTRNRSAIGTLVERTSRAVVLVHLGVDRTASALRDALVAIYRGHAGGAAPLPDLGSG